MNIFKAGKQYFLAFLHDSPNRYITAANGIVFVDTDSDLNQIAALIEKKGNFKNVVVINFQEVEADNDQQENISGSVSAS